MYRNRILIGLAVAIVVALIASSFVYRQMKQAAAAPKTFTTKLVVAAASLPLGTRLESRFLREVPWSGGDPLPGMFTSVEACSGRALITSVVENEPILETKLAPKEAGAGLAAVIPEGKRAMSVKVDEVIGVAGFVLPSTMVDVLVTGSVAGNRGGGSDSITRVILENIRVLTAGQQVQEDKDGKPQKVSVVTLLVTPEEAAQLAMASTEGRIQLALRNTIDGEKVEPAVVYRTSIFSGGRPANPRPGIRREEPPPTYMVEIIRGDKRETKTFAQ